MSDSLGIVDWMMGLLSANLILCWFRLLLMLSMVKRIGTRITTL
eukprot:COSAG04_NODE_659_length_11458_cov_3.404173_7_plen_44_part_00